MKTTAPAVIVTLLLLPFSVAYSHDIWLLPEQFTLSRGDTLTVRQLVGTELDSELDLPLLMPMTPRFELITQDGSVDLLNELRGSRTQSELIPVLERKLDLEGLVLLTMEHDFIYDEFSNEKFLEYLTHEEYEIEEFQDQLGRKPEQSERYARTLKSLVQVGKVSEGELYRRVLGQKIEILLLQNPYLLDPGDEMEVQVLFTGKPLHDQLVMAFNRDGEGPIAKSKARTNPDGIARFTLDKRGIWLLRLVHLLPCSDRFEDDCDDVDWESYWTSFTFRLD